MRETWLRSLGWEDPLEKGTATHSSLLAWRIPKTVYPHGHKELDMTERLSLYFTSITSHIHNWVLFLLWLHPFILSGVISPLISSSILGTYHSGEFLLQYPIFLPFHTVHVWVEWSQNRETQNQGTSVPVLRARKRI